MSGALHWRALLAFAVTGAVLIAVVAGFLATGTPDEARRGRLDMQRIEHLQAIETAVERYYADHAELPSSLEELKRRESLAIAIVDPETGAPYGYRPTDVREYELCATYALATKDESPSHYLRSWAHPAGQHCHHFTVPKPR